MRVAQVPLHIISLQLRTQVHKCPQVPVHKCSCALVYTSTQVQVHKCPMCTGSSTSVAISFLCHMTNYNLLLHLLKLVKHWTCVTSRIGDFIWRILPCTYYATIWTSCVATLQIVQYKPTMLAGKALLNAIKFPFHLHEWRNFITVLPIQYLYYTVLSYDTVLSCFTSIDVTTFIANYIERGDINLHFSVRITVQQLFEVSYQSNSDEIQCTKSYSREVP